MKIKLLTLLLLITNVVPLHSLVASETTIINNVSVKAETGGRIATPGETITTGEARSEVTLYSELDGEVVTDVYKEVIADDSASITIEQMITDDIVSTSIVTSTDGKRGGNSDTVQIASDKENDAPTDSDENENKTVKQNIKSMKVEKAVYAFILTIFHFISNTLLGIFK